jgi:hypothetical protein
MNSLIKAFLSTDWPTVLTAKEKIENLENSGIPEIIGLLSECKVHKLENTGDLIYPGAEKYFGHGQIIDYDIDDICVRAGWLLEDLTFRNFGFTGIHLADQELTGFIRENFPNYCSDPANILQLDQLSATGKRRLIRALSIEQVRSWWPGAASNWNRLQSLEDALKSGNEKCQVKALFYMRNGRTQCTGLDENFYISRLEELVKKLSKSETSRISEHAKLIMLDSDYDWLKIKPKD